MGQKHFALAIDQGTTATTILVLQLGGEQPLLVLGRASVEHPQFYPKSGWVEHDLDAIWLSLKQATLHALENAKQSSADFSPNKLGAIGISNQRETWCAFNKKGEALSKAVVWQCKRGLELCDQLKKQGLEKTIRLKTGLLLDPYFSSTKASWLLQNNAAIKEALARNDLLFGTIDTFLLYRLTGCKSFKTESSNASRTMLYNIHQGSYDEELLEIFGLPNAEFLPSVEDSIHQFGVTTGLDFLPDGIPITAILGDQQAALAGQGCLEVGTAKCTYGTGAFLLVNVGAKPSQPPPGVLLTVAWQLNGKLVYALEGSCFVAGASMQFLRDQFNFFKENKTIEALAREAVAAPEIYFVSALSGLGAPYWQPKVKGAFLGMTRGTTMQQIIRAGLESIALQVKDLTDVLVTSTGNKLKSLSVDGGAVQNNLLLETQADLLEIPVLRPKLIETTALGAGLFAAFGAKMIDKIEKIHLLNPIEKEFVAEQSVGRREWVKQTVSGWKKAVRSVQVFAED